MWPFMGSMGWWMWLWWVFGLLFLVLIIRMIGGAGGGFAGRTDDSPEQILKRRYARGELEREEYQRRLEDLRR